MESEWKLIHVYTRAQALADGVLVDASRLAPEAGFKVPVALTAAAWELCVTVPSGAKAAQDETGRLWDVLMMCRYAIRGQKLEECDLRFGLAVVTGRGSELVTLKAVMGPGDDGRPCLTIMLPEED